MIFHRLGLAARRLGLGLLGLALIMDRAQGIEALGGISVVDEGDDRPRPAVHLQVGAKDRFQGRAYAWGRTFGPVAEQTILLAGGAEFGLPKLSKALSGVIGPALLWERTTIDPAESPDGAEDVEGGQATTRDDNGNLGLLLGVHYRPSKGPFLIDFGWDSHIFLAGVAGLLLTTARRQALSISFGVTL